MVTQNSDVPLKSFGSHYEAIIYCSLEAIITVYNCIYICITISGPELLLFSFSLIELCS